MGATVRGNEVSHRNQVVLLGRISRIPEKRRLPSGDQLVSVHVVVERDAGPVLGRDAAPDRGRSAKRKRGRGPSFDVIECVAWSAGPRRSVSSWAPGDIVEVSGALRRRFLRTGDGSPVSRYQVEIARSRRIRRRPSTRPGSMT